jgi:hypothetical protein
LVSRKLWLATIWLDSPALSQMWQQAALGSLLVG